MVTVLDNVNFKLLLKAHNGNIERSLKAWEFICNAGKFGNVPASYEGGLDVKGLRLALDEKGEVKEMRVDPLTAESVGRFGVSVKEDDLKRIEDVAAGDKPR